MRSQRSKPIRRKPPQPTWPGELGGAVRARRRLLRLTQAELASLAEVGLAFMYELEQGKATLRLDKLVDVLSVLGLEIKVVQGKGGFAVDPALLAQASESES